MFEKIFILGYIARQALSEIWRRFIFKCRQVDRAVDRFFELVDKL